ncbi:MAG: hypothetical protein ACLQGP_22935 [Isosphaeraceae bacterium]
MSHNPFLRFFTLIRKIRRVPSGNGAIAGYQLADPPRFDDLPTVDLSKYESRVAESPRSLISGRVGTPHWPSVSRTTSRTASLCEVVPIIPADHSAAPPDAVSPWPAAPLTSRLAARRLRAVDRAIAEMARSRRPR